MFAEFRQRLLSWGKQNTKKYPWRWINDPYRVLVSEFMLHRTQARQVIPIYNQFLIEYPTLEAFSKADKVRVRDILNSLGLHWRIDAMVAALSQLWSQYGEIPVDREKLILIGGIGPYIASATVCFTQNEPVALIDTNTVRVIGRVFGLDIRGEARRRKSIIDAITNTCDPNQPRDYYYALIDFAHEVCTPRRPDCKSCPLLDLPCQFGNNYVQQMEI